MLLNALPLSDVELVKKKDGSMGPPNSMNPRTFHRRHWRDFEKRLGPNPPLHSLRLHTILFLQERFPPNEENHWKWYGVNLTPEQIDECVTCATYHYGIACVKLAGYRAVANFL